MSLRSATALCILACTSFLALVVTIGCSNSGGQVKEAEKGPIPKPEQLIGKSIEDCEKILGKPDYKAGVGTGNYKDHGNMAQSLYYKFPGLTRIVLIRVVDKPSRPGRLDSNFDKRPLKPMVSSVNYVIPKAQVKTWKEALKLLRIESKEVDVVTFPTGFVMLKNIPGSFQGSWSPAGAHDGPNNNYFVRDKANHSLKINSLGTP